MKGNKLKKFIAMFVGLVMALSLMGAFVPAAASTNTGGSDKVGICHRTGSDTNPYVYIEVPEDEANGHITGDSKQHNSKVTWKSDGTWNGVAHKAGDVKLDYFATTEDKATNCGERSTTPPPPSDYPYEITVCWEVIDWEPGMDDWPQTRLTTCEFAPAVCDGDSRRYQTDTYWIRDQADEDYLDSLTVLNSSADDASLEPHDYFMTTVIALSGQDCVEQPQDERETRSSSVTDCKADTVTTTHEERTRSYVWDGDSYEPAAWSAWTVYDTDVRDATNTECPPSQPQAKAWVKTRIIDGCKLRDDVWITAKRHVAKTSVTRVTPKKWVVRATAKPGYVFVKALGGEKKYKKVYRLTNNTYGCSGS